jgi:amidase
LSDIVAHPSDESRSTQVSGCEKIPGASQEVNVITRRTLLGSSLAGGALALTSPLVPRLAAADAPPSTPFAIPSFDLDEFTIDALQAAMTSGKLTSRQIVEKYLARIAMLDQQGPKLRSIIELNPDALSIADALDAERKEKGPRGPLHGIPILIKDNIDTGDRMLTTAGSLALTGSKAKEDAFIVKKLRESGAVLLGKTNLSEWANFRSTHGSSGWSGRGGQARNPYALDRNTSGSSSGSAAAVAANFCAASIGSETDGSIVSPASVNGIVGIKPTVGLLSRSGIIPISATQDTAGPMARTVRDAAILLSALAAVDPNDKATTAAGTHIEADYTKFLDAKGLRGARLGIVRAKQFGMGERLDSILADAITALKAQGAEVIDPVEIPHLGEYDDAELTVLFYEFKDGLNKYLAARASDNPMKTLKDLIDFNDRHASEELPWFGQELFITAQEKGPLTSKEYLEALAKCRELSREKGIDAVMKEKKLDALVSITNGASWPIDLINGDRYTGGNSSPAAVAGYPHVTVPSGWFHGLPIGLSFFGRAWSEGPLIKLAYAYEQATKARKGPGFVTSGELA